MAELTTVNDNVCRLNFRNFDAVEFLVDWQDCQLLMLTSASMTAMAAVILFIKLFARKLDQ